MTMGRDIDNVNFEDIDHTRAGFCLSAAKAVGAIEGVMDIYRSQGPFHGIVRPKGALSAEAEYE